MAVAFTERELDIMAVLWERGPSTVAEVRAALADPLTHNTVATMLTILEKKGHAAHAEEGRSFRYRSLVERETAGRNAFTRIADAIFGGSHEALLTNFVRDRRLTKEELQRIRRVVDERLENEDPAPKRPTRGKPRR